MDTNNVVRMDSSSFSKQYKEPINARRASCFGALPTFLIVTLTVFVACWEPIVADKGVQNLNQAPGSMKNLGQVLHEPHNGALEAELNSIVQQHDGLDINNKQLAEAIISRLMVDNLTGAGLSTGANELENEISTDIQTGNELLSQELVEPYNGGDQATAAGGQLGSESVQLRKLLNALRNYEASLASGAGVGAGLTLVPYPILPNGQAATMKRATMKMGNLLQQQRARQNYDFGLGKRPDAAIAGNILRYGDSGSVGQIQPVSQFGKRPSSHRYDFGLGKRVASPAYPRYDFGLGKRVPNRIRYDFGLGK